MSTAQVNPAPVVNTVQIELDGQAIEVPVNSTIMDAANKAGVYIPHFCYHRKLSIAANCRMCLVEVEKSPKPLPACASPVTQGMKVFTKSPAAVRAQKGVMEFLLINHPLDCPICDQGGECQLQDLAVGYGSTASRYQEQKRVVLNKNLGPLISTDMTRCIHCTRCVRFGEEIAGKMELGMAHRGEHCEIMPFIERTVDSELSGNMIDVCPVGALTSKPFRYAARTWELGKRKSIAPHDSLGSHVTVQVKQDRVLRVTPLENEAVNECWLSDRDRFSYEALDSDDRLLCPMVREGETWVQATWEQALARAVAGLQAAGSSTGWLLSPNTTLEEGHLAARLARGTGSANIDFRLRQSDFAADGVAAGAPWLGMPIAEVQGLKGLLIVGSNLRKDHPLLAHRVRAAAGRGAAIHTLGAWREELLCPVAGQAMLPPSQWETALEGVLAAVEAERAGRGGQGEYTGIAAALCVDAPRAVWLGNEAVNHPRASRLRWLAQRICEASGAMLGTTVEGSNAVGLAAAGVLPGTRGKHAQAMLAKPLKAFMLLNAEPGHDCADGGAALRAMKAADTVVCLTTHRDGAADYADVLLPVAAWTETAGTRVNCEGRAQAFVGVVPPAGEARPAWKVLRVLGNLLGLKGFEQESIDDVRRDLGLDAEKLAAALANTLTAEPQTAPPELAGLERAGFVMPYGVDALTRR
ncbi:MAG: NADH-quinone oxidoreductase subunit G, partial [Rhodocyclaceae bacterium]|nr:NADH-quinone oxidoreductase subunit G [Rhodocyclaceae bacterium]